MMRDFQLFFFLQKKIKNEIDRFWFSIKIL